jgi:hypothetical protein
MSHCHSIVNLTWIANKLIDKFKIQPNMPLDVIQNEVKDKGKVDVTPNIMYRARRNFVEFFLVNWRINMVGCVTIGI